VYHGGKEVKTLEDLPPEFHQIPDVQALYGFINGLLTGTKKLVIESEAVGSQVISHDPYQVAPSYRHTFRVEDTNAKEGV
jgi:hypothetical protein